METPMPDFLAVSDQLYALMRDRCLQINARQERVQPHDAAALGVPLESLQSLACQMFARRMRETSHLHRAELTKYRVRWDAGESIVAIGVDVGYSPYLLVRREISRATLTRMTAFAPARALRFSRRCVFSLRVCAERQKR